MLRNLKKASQFPKVSDKSKFQVKKLMISLSDGIFQNRLPISDKKNIQNETIIT